ncbi:MAG: hypothetical protein IPN76_08925 [Saprospiraceae bacterium]|nr:hypothetical protein [Saprospiraceae bacterium]
MEVFEEERAVLKAYIELHDNIIALNKSIKKLQADLETKVWAKYPTLTDDELKTLVVDDKWIATLDAAVATEMQRISQRLTQRIKELADRYDTPLPRQLEAVKALEEKVNAHLEKMGYTWK